MTGEITNRSKSGEEGLLYHEVYEKHSGASQWILEKLKGNKQADHYKAL